jgi:hypothetical protein
MEPTRRIQTLEKESTKQEERKMMPPEYSNMPGFISARMGGKSTIKDNKGMEGMR